MSRRRSLSLLCSLTAGIALTLGATSALADVQPTGATPADETITTTIVFNVTHPDKLARYIHETVTPGSPHYRDFLSVQEFVVHYAPHRGQIQKTARYLESFGIKVDKVYADHLAMTVSGPASAFNQVFNTELANYQETAPAAHPHRRGHFHRPKSQPHLPKLLQDNDVLAVVGLSNEYQFKPMHVHTPVPHAGSTARLPVMSSDGNTIATGVPGQLTVGDVANIYNINPLYAAGISGTGMTLGIASYSTVDPADAYGYWDIIGLNYKSDRISRVHVDGGAGFAGGETTLDVEQSGGLAPAANVIVYDAPNSSLGGIDMFYTIVSDNKADTLSYSWGLPEIFYFPELNGGVDFTDTMTAQNQAFMEAAVQGMSVFAATGDSGAYDTVRDYFQPQGSAPLAVDWPASSPYITAAGGTTLPILAGYYFLCNGQKYPIDVPHRRAWSWDYVAAAYQCFGAKAFSVGDGGGVSVFWHRPSYQDGLAGIQLSQAGQYFPFFGGLDLLAGFAGRNIPDISMNADPYSGYLYLFGGALIGGEGGTSFVAPQLNGIAALIGQKAGTRIGLLNPQLYRLLSEYGYGPDSPFNDITHGNNWYWQGAPGYDPASGVGTPNVARLAAALSAEPAQAH